jgi:2-pyrone-4,6-dicarboxylate lactonase
MGASPSVPNAVDCHFHVIGPHANFPMHPARSYTPAQADVQQWREVLGPLGITHGVAVQPSVYGTDNRALLAALAEGAGQLVGVAAVDASATDTELMVLASAGVRGVRMAHFEAGDPRAMGGFVSTHWKIDCMPMVCICNCSPTADCCPVSHSACTRQGCPW